MFCKPLMEKAKNRMERWIAIRLLARPFVKTHGLLRSGTNYMQKLLENNFYVVCPGPSEGGWKHGHCIYEPEKKYVFLVKNPYAWLYSFRNWEIIHNRSLAKSLGEFATQLLSHTQLMKEWDLNTPVEAWNRAHASWLSYCDRENTIFIRYEDLIDDVEAQLVLIRDKFSLRARDEKFVNINSRADTWDTPNPRKALEIDFYRHERYLEEFDEQTLAILREQLDRSLLSRFNYQMY